MLFPPNIGSLRANGMVVCLSDLVAEAKRTLGDVLIVVSGDFNQWPVNDLLEEHPDLSKVDHGPTRQGRSIDRTFVVNFPRAVTASGTSIPLETEEESPSDHQVAYANASFEANKPKKISYFYHAFTPEGAEKFAEGLRNLDWSDLYQSAMVEEKARVFQNAIDALMDTCFKWRTTVCESENVG